ncbi:TadE family type IV pilus minor pilin [Streptomyces sp. MST-110588]|uniref:TadE family type IV pilus minor pilin n=1 Tax=Streptomyces sp. MST-110588 TaxID=2833628 RepID=UPI001F5CE2CD|nr:TadE family type IV pilus minor pilin [Streptomyces sp. MST-110588]UNO40682.1 pilus assembly protein [Streptomyces sp. MST-110588]
MRRSETAVGRDGGFVTAEAAVVAPVLVLFTGLLLWGVMAACAQIRCVDAARAGARAAARSEPSSAVLKAARDAAPPGAQVLLTRNGDLVRVRVDAAAPGTGPLSLPLRGEATALAEETVRG